MDRNGFSDFDGSILSKLQDPQNQEFNNCKEDFKDLDKNESVDIQKNDIGEVAQNEFLDVDKDGYSESEDKNDFGY